MNVTITPTPLCGTVTPPPSKSQAHRLIIGAALSAGESVISGVDLSQDIAATLSCMEALGAQTSWADKTTVHIRGMEKGHGTGSPVLQCGESGSTLRFLIPIALAVSGGGTFHGRGRLMQRPQTPYFEIFREKHIAFFQKDDTLTVNGTLPAGRYSLPGDVSSQFVTGLMYALPLCAGDSEIVLTTPLESAGYIDMTLDALKTFGITVLPTQTGWHVPGGQSYAPARATVEADYSQAAFFCAAKGMGSPLEIVGMNPDSRQGDRIILSYEALLDAPGPVTLDVRACPDLVPALAVRAALRAGEVTKIVNAARLRIKESDRLASVTSVLTALGADVREEPEGLTIYGKQALSGGVTVDAWNDHRIAMMAAIAATRCLAPITITGAQCVNKSYPGFWRDYAALGGTLEEKE